MPVISYEFFSAMLKIHDLFYLLGFFLFTFLLLILLLLFPLTLQPKKSVQLFKSL